MGEGLEAHSAWCSLWCSLHLGATSCDCDWFEKQGRPQCDCDAVGDALKRLKTAASTKIRASGSYHPASKGNEHEVKTASEGTKVPPVEGTGAGSSYDHDGWCIADETDRWQCPARGCRAPAEDRPCIAKEQQPSPPWETTGPIAGSAPWPPLKNQRVRCRPVSMGGTVVDIDYGDGCPLMVVWDDGTRSAEAVADVTPDAVADRPSATEDDDRHPDGGSLRFGKEVCPDCKLTRDTHDEWDFRFCNRRLVEQKRTRKGVAEVLAATPIARPAEEMFYACVNCQASIPSHGMCATCSRAYGIGRAEAVADRPSAEPFDVEAFERDRGFWLGKPSRLRFDDVAAMLAEIKRLRSEVKREAHNRVVAEEGASEARAAWAETNAKLRAADSSCPAVDCTCETSPLALCPKCHAGIDR